MIHSGKPALSLRVRTLTLSLACLSFLLGSGCQPGPEMQMEQLREQILTDQLPSGVLSLAEATAGFEEGMQTQVVGRIFADQMSPFDPDSAAFSLIELPKPGHDHENPGDCPFCKREMENAATAIVQVVDSSDEVLKFPAEQLLELEENQDIVVRGKATKVGDVLIVSATAVHVLSAEDGKLFAKRIHEQPEE